MILAINTDTGGVSEYDLTAVDVATGADGGVRVATSAGVLAQSAGAEAVTVDLRTGALNLGVAGRKVVSEAVLTIASDGITTVTVTADVGGHNRVIGTYTIPGRSHGGQVTQTLKLGRGVKLDSIALKIQNGSCTAWKLLGLSFTAHALRVRG